jgi:uroporphyrin-III C-methyltransferase
MLFGRAQEEIDALTANGIEYEVVPGVTAALGASAELGVSLTRRGMSRSVVFATPRIGKDQDDDARGGWAHAVAAADTAVLYMSRGEAPQLVAALRAAGLSADHPAAIVESASLPRTRQLRCTLEQLPAQAAQTSSGPALVILGKVLTGAAAASAPSTAENAGDSAVSANSQRAVS